MYKFLLKSHGFPPTLILRILPLLCGLGIEVEASGADVHLVIVEIRFFRAVCTAHIACEGVILEFLPIRTKVAVALD